jgi:Holliday junction resolvase RusA-like endonuclease
VFPTLLGTLSHKKEQVLDSKILKAYIINMSSSVAHHQQVPTCAFKAEAMAMLSPDGHLTLFIEVEGEPVAQQRVRSRWLQRAQRIVHYNPCAQLKYAFADAVKAALQESGISRTGGFPIFEDRPLKIKVAFRVGNAMKDLDNLLKFAFDALQKIVYGDDRYIYQVTGIKIPVTESYSTSIEISYL